jgi:hypothetical protein
MTAAARVRQNLTVSLFPFKLLQFFETHDTREACNCGGIKSWKSYATGWMSNSFNLRSAVAGWKQVNICSPQTTHILGQLVFQRELEIYTERTIHLVLTRILRYRIYKRK